MFDVFLTPIADAELAATFHYIRRKAPLAARAWLSRIHNATQTLRTMPERCGRAAEADTTGRDVRELLIGRKPNKFRIVFTIHPGVVWVRHIVRANRRPIPPGRF